MPSKDSITKTIRLNASDSVALEHLMEEYGLSWSGAIHKLIDDRGTPQKEEKCIGVHPKNVIEIPKGTPLELIEKLKETLKTGCLTGVHPSEESGVHPFVPQNFIRKETQEDIERMCHLCGISTELFFDEVDRLFNEGKLEVDCMKLKSNGEYDLSTLESVCHLNNVSVDDAIDKIIVSMSRNRR